MLLSVKYVSTIIVQACDDPVPSDARTIIAPGVVTTIPSDVSTINVPAYNAYNNPVSLLGCAIDVSAASQSASQGHDNLLYFLSTCAKCSQSFRIRFIFGTCVQSAASQPASQPTLEAVCCTVIMVQRKRIT